MNLAKRYRVKEGHKVDLASFDTRDTGDVDDKEEGRRRLRENIGRLNDLQARLYAEHKRSLLVVLQGMDTAGKDGTIRRVMTGVNPQGCRVQSFKSPSAEELNHDFLWRIHKAVPSRGMIGLFNRSHYEDVLIVRVHDLVPESIWSARYGQINRFEQNLVENGTTILKFFIHISRDEQKKRLQARLEDPGKTWKFNPADIKERKKWDDYIEAYEAVLEKCSTRWAPWFVIPSDRKWHRNLAVSEILADTLESMDLQIPKPDFDPAGIVIE